MAGLTSTGLQIKLLEDIVSDIGAKELALISPSIDLQPTAIIGVLNGIFAEEIYELWQIMGALYNGMDPSQAVGDQLASLALLTGVSREAATDTVVVGATVNVNAGFSAAPGTMFASVVGNPSVQFKNVQAVSNPGGSPANETVDFVATTTGPVQALATTLTVIAQPLSGWNSVTNAVDGVAGRSIETDSALRTRRQNELTSFGNSTADAILSDVYASNDTVPALYSTPILSATVLYNDKSVTDSNGLPPHFVEVIVYQPGSTLADDAALAKVILNAKAAGDGTNGTSSAVAVDSENNNQVVNFTRTTTERLYVAITVVTDPNTFPLDGIAQVKAALANFAVATYVSGSTVYAKHLQFEAFNVLGVLDISAFAVGLAPSPTLANNITTTVRQLAQLSTGDVAVTVT